MRRSLIFSLVGFVVVAFGSLAFTMVKDYKPELGLDLQGGASVVLAPPEDVNVPSGVLNQSVEIIRNRVDALGVAEPDISRQGNSIIVQLPGVKNAERALDLVGQTAELRFRPVLQELPLDENTPVPQAPAPAPTPEGQPPAAAAEPPKSEPVKTTPREEDVADKEVVLPVREGSGPATARYRLGPALMTGKGVRTARGTLRPDTGQWAVELEFNRQGRADFQKIIDQYAGTGTPIAFTLDGVVKSAPVIQPDLKTGFDGTTLITGGAGDPFKQGDAKNLALVLKYGALPVQLRPLSVETVSASLGRDSLRAGIIAGLIGLSLVALYMVMYYRALGIVVILGLGVSGALLWSFVSYMGHSSGLALSLSGAVGIIVSVGVTVDSYVVYFERLKDEIRAGRSIRTSVDRGFTRAYRTILAGDFVSLIGATLLYLLTVGAVRGFAFFLGVSTVLDMITAYFFTRPMVILLGRNRLFTEARFLGVARGLLARPAGSAT